MSELFHLSHFPKHSLKNKFLILNPRLHSHTNANPKDAPLYTKFLRFGLNNFHELIIHNLHVFEGGHHTGIHPRQDVPAQFNLHYFVQLFVYYLDIQFFYWIRYVCKLYFVRIKDCAKLFA